MTKSFKRLLFVIASVLVIGILFVISDTSFHPPHAESQNQILTGGIIQDSNKVYSESQNPSSMDDKMVIEPEDAVDHQIITLPGNPDIDPNFTIPPEGMTPLPNK